MSKIIELGADIIPKIAAGEVVERPISVVKELVENSLDAGAKKIVVEIEYGGIKKIKVLDDGVGMSKEDLLKSFLPHTTSKLQFVEDLSLIRTFGFRGEALSSITAVADVQIKTGEKGKHGGHSVFIRNSKFENPVSAAMSHGTIVEVTNLFSYVPARKKFLKSAVAESQLISNVLVAFALAHPTVGFEFYRDGKQVFKVLAKDSLVVRIGKLLGKQLAGQCIPVNYKDSYLKIHGYIAKPQGATQSRGNQFLFVNKRIVEDLPISKAIKDAYKTLLDVRSYPSFVLNIDLDWGLVDVNVHPQKERVKFWNDATVQKAVFDAVVDALSKSDLTYVVGEPSDVRDKKAVGHLYQKLKDATPLWDVRSPNVKSNYEAAFQVADTYIVYPEKSSLVLVDQHAAHESILFDQLLKNYQQHLRVSESYTLTTAEMRSAFTKVCLRK